MSRTPICSIARTPVCAFAVRMPARSATIAAMQMYSFVKTSTPPR
jgi:hypothetical protein